MTALIVAHGHPRFSKGGAEIAAYRLYHALQQLQGWENTIFLAACNRDDQIKPGCEIHGLAKTELLVRRSNDPFLHDTNLNLTTSSHGFLFHALKNLNPSVVHVHHYIHVGMDIVHALKRWFPLAKFIFTLHEYYGMCPYEGRLLKVNGDFCRGPQPDECLLCCGPEKLVKLPVRRLRVEHLFSVFDHFISPSHFLAQRYIEWGLDSSKISIIENLPLQCSNSPQSCNNQNRQEKNSVSEFVFAYFGQVNRWKGIDIILEAFAIVVDQYPKARLELHGLSKDLLRDTKKFHDSEFLLACRKMIHALPLNSIRLMCVYQSSELDSRLHAVDAVVMASRWYENAPMVIQESFSRSVPVLAPDYGGMAEKIDHEVNGLLYDRCDAISLAGSMNKLLDQPQKVVEMGLNARRKSLSYDSILQSHLICYEG